MKPKIIFPLLTFIVILIIWGHSLTPGDISSLESGFIADILKSVFPVDDPNFNHTVRKAAHYTEYFILGIMLSIDTTLLTGRSFSPYSVIIGLFVPLTDESLQLFTFARSGQIMDIWLDISGFISGFIFCAVITKAIQIYNKRNPKNGGCRKTKLFAKK